MVSEVENRIIDCIDGNQSFVLEAGAGSGKTWTLIQIILYVINKRKVEFSKKRQKIACITYTRVARDEIIERVSANAEEQLVLSNTIHEFLWDNIKQFNQEIKLGLIQYIEDKKSDKKLILDKSNPTTKKYREAELSLTKYEERLQALKSFQGRLSYQNIPNWSKGVISHDEVLYIAHYIFETYRVIRKILQDTYPVIFIDEYQDTSPLVKEILLDFLLPNTEILFGFFGDSMQQIYDTSMGELDAEAYDLELITKEENYRSSIAVIKLINQIRDDIQQKPAGQIKEGKCLFYYLNDIDIDEEELIEFNIIKSFKLDDSESIKRLYLTTASIARQNNYINLHNLYSSADGKNKDEILKNSENRSCVFANYLHDLEKIIELFETKRIQEMLGLMSYEIKDIQAKRYLNDSLIELSTKRDDWSIGEVIDYANKILPMKYEMSFYYGDEAKFTKDEFFLSLISISYTEFKNLYYTAKGDSLYSTEHGTKGDEYNHVVCIVNDNDWYNYSLTKYLDGSDLKTNHEKRYYRTKRLFYVVCSRAINNLAVLMLSSLTDDAINQVKKIFGSDNFIDMSAKQ